MGLALRSDVLDTIRSDIAPASDLDAALLRLRASKWTSSYPLAFSLGLRAAAHRLPQASVEHPRPEALIRRHVDASVAPEVLRSWVFRRLTQILERPAVDGEAEVIVVRFSWVFRGLPFFLAFVVVHVLGNAWCTARRMSSEPVGCQYGWSADVGDDLRYYTACPRLASAAIQCGRRPPPWVGIGNVRVAALALPLNRRDVLDALSGCTWSIGCTPLLSIMGGPSHRPSSSAPSVQSPRAVAPARTPSLGPPSPRAADAEKFVLVWPSPSWSCGSLFEQSCQRSSSAAGFKTWSRTHCRFGSADGYPYEYLGASSCQRVGRAMSGRRYLVAAVVRVFKLPAKHISHAAHRSGIASICNIYSKPRSRARTT